MVPAAGGMASTMGGPKIDKDARVVNFEMKPIPGLYAAGAAAAGSGTRTTSAATSWAAAWCSAASAARHAATRAKASKAAK